MAYKYIILLPLATLEGPFVMMFSGSLIKLEYLSFWPAFVILMCGDLLADIWWYWVGRTWGERFIRRFGKFFGITMAEVEKVKTIFHLRKNTILFVSKVTMGFGFAIAVLLTAGMVRIPFKTYLLMNGLGQIVWTGLLVAVGFFFGNFYQSLNSMFEQMTFIAGACILMWLLFRFARLHIRHRTEKHIV